MKNIVVFILLPICIFMAPNAIGSDEAAKTASQFLQAYQSKNWVKFAKFIPGSNAQTFESDESMTSGWRWQAASNWNGTISGVRYTTDDAANGAKEYTAYAKFGESGNECFIVAMGLDDGKWYVEDIHSPECSEFYSYSRTSEIVTSAVLKENKRTINEKKVDNESEEAIGQARKDAYQQYISAYNKLTQLVSEGKGDTPQAQTAFEAYELKKEKYENLLKENESTSNESKGSTTSHDHQSTDSLTITTSDKKDIETTKVLQTRLKKLGYYDGPIDGDMEKTRPALRKFMSEKPKKKQSTSKLITEKTQNSIQKADELVTTSSGLKYQDIVKGNGKEALTGKEVSVHYTGWLMDGTKFDSSLDRGAPFKFTLGAGRVIKGWDEGVAEMKVGGKRVLFIPSKLAYGARGAGKIIPPNSKMKFEVELLDVK